jgi:uncharacterized metal-binding protein YceD (DUF177 family)
VTRPELHRPVRIARIGADGLDVVVESTEAERAVLAARMGLPAIEALVGRFALTSGASGVVLAHGRLEAVVVQTCVVSLEDFQSRIGEDFAVHFVPEGTERDDPDPESIDEIPYAGDAIDLGEATTEQLALALDPYPHRPGAALPDTATGTDPRLTSLAAWRDPKRGSQ